MTFVTGNQRISVGVGAFTVKITTHRPAGASRLRSEEHTSELQSRVDLVCRLLLEKKKKMSQTRGKRAGDLRGRLESTSRDTSTRISAASDPLSTTRNCTTAQIGAELNERPTKVHR